MGLRTIVSHGLDGRMKFVRDEKLIDPFSVWKDMRRERFAHEKPIYLAVLALIAAAFVRVTWRVRSLWIAQALSLALVIGSLEMTCYYYSFFVLAALLSRIGRGWEQIALFVAGFSELLVLNGFVSYYYDDRYTAQSVLFLLFAIGILCAFWPRRRRAAATPTATGIATPV